MKLYYHYLRTEGSGLPGILITVFIYVFVMFAAGAILYMYFLRSVVTCASSIIICLFISSDFREGTTRQSLLAQIDMSVFVSAFLPLSRIAGVELFISLLHSVLCVSVTSSSLNSTSPTSLAHASPSCLQSASPSLPSCVRLQYSSLLFPPLPSSLHVRTTCNLFSVTVLDVSVTLVIPLMCSFRTLSSSHRTSTSASSSQHPHPSILISASSSQHPDLSILISASSSQHPHPIRCYPCFSAPYSITDLITD